MRLSYVTSVVLNLTTGGVLIKEKKGRLETQRQSRIIHKPGAIEKLEEAKNSPLEP